MKHLRKLTVAVVCVVGLGFFAFRNDERFFEIARKGHLCHAVQRIEPLLRG